MPEWLWITLTSLVYLVGAVVTAIITYGEHEVPHRGPGWRVAETRVGIDGGAESGAQRDDA